jgi:hypothetical protein
VEEQITPGGIGTSAIKLTLVLAGTLTAIFTVMVLFLLPTKEPECSRCLTFGQLAGLAIVLALIYVAMTAALAGISALIIAALRPRWRGASIVSWCAMTAIVVPPVLLVLSFYALGGTAARPY